MRTTALFSFAADASEKGFPSRVVSWKSGAAVPIAGASATAAADTRPRTASRVRVARKARMKVLLEAPNAPVEEGYSREPRRGLDGERRPLDDRVELPDVLVRAAEELDLDQIGRASCRERVKSAVAD